MADFRTHVVGAIAPSVVLAMWLAHEQAASLATCLACVVCGGAGGLLPDIDSESSISTRLVFTIIGACAGLLAAKVAYESFAGGYQLVAPVAALLLTYALTRYVISGLFHKLTVHRGLIHSLPMAVVFGLGQFHALSWLLPGAREVALWPSLFLAGGFVTHLLLDELFSVDLQGLRLKRSFGSALKLGSRRNRLGTLALYVACGAMLAPLLGFGG